MKNKADEIAAKEAILIDAHNAMIEWGMLKCDQGRMRLPIKFVLAMEELDKGVDRLETIRRAQHDSAERK